MQVWRRFRLEVCSRFGHRGHLKQIWIFFLCYLVAQVISVSLWVVCVCYIYPCVSVLRACMYVCVCVSVFRSVYARSVVVAHTYRFVWANSLKFCGTRSLGKTHGRAWYDTYLYKYCSLMHTLQYVYKYFHLLCVLYLSINECMCFFEVFNIEHSWCVYIYGIRFKF